MVLHLGSVILCLSKVEIIFEIWNTITYLSLQAFHSQISGVPVCWLILELRTWSYELSVFGVCMAHRETAQKAYSIMCPKQRCTNRKLYVWCKFKKGIARSSTGNLSKKSKK